MTVGAGVARMTRSKLRVRLTVEVKQLDRDFYWMVCSKTRMVQGGPAKSRRSALVDAALAWAEYNGWTP